MKLKYKFTILWVTMFVLFIGFIIFSLVPDKNKGEEKKTAMATPAPVETMNPNGLPAVDEDVLKCNAYPEINELMEKYLTARAECDVDTLKTLISGTNSFDEEQLAKKVEHIEGYENISCYTLEGPSDGTYLVYVYEELKIRGIDTLAPGMIRIFVSLAEDGKPYVYYGPVDDEMVKFMNEASENEEVKKLLTGVNEKLVKAMASDEALKEFNERLTEAKQGDTQGEQNKDTDKADNTEKE